MNVAQYLPDWITHPLSRAAIVLCVSVLVAAVADLFMTHVVARITQKTKTDLDDKILETVRRPLAISFVLVGTWYAIQILHPPEIAHRLIRGVLSTIAVMYWFTAAYRTSGTILELLSRHQNRIQLVQARTLPVFEIGLKIAVIGGGTYFLLLAWEVDVTGWLASAGIMGIAVGFAAKDTLANLFAGVFIIADAPYKPGDYLVLDSGERGRVTDIGIRSTRMLTDDDIQIIMPNAEMAAAKIKNESGGPHEHERVTCDVGVAYGSDIDRVRAILLEEGSASTLGLKNTANPKLRPSVMFFSMGDSALQFKLRVWVERPELKNACLDDLNTRVYKRLVAEGIEIPYPKRDVYVHHVDS